MRWIKMFEEFGMGAEKQVVAHLLEELEVEGQMEDLGPMVTWYVPYEDDSARTMKELKAVLDEHADILAHDLPGAVIERYVGIAFHYYGICSRCVAFRQDGFEWYCTNGEGRP